MTPLMVDTPADLAPHAGALLGLSGWITVDQPMIDTFAALTGDDHWIHVDVARAAQAMPGGRTIAHGLMLLALIPALQRQIYGIRHRGIGLNYGYDRVRFIAPVPVDSRLRLSLRLDAVEPHAQGTRIITEAAMEVEGAGRPALSARNILLIKAAA